MKSWHDQVSFKHVGREFRDVLIDGSDEDRARVESAYTLKCIHTPSFKPRSDIQAFVLSVKEHWFQCKYFSDEDDCRFRRHLRAKKTSRYLREQGDILPNSALIQILKDNIDVLGIDGNKHIVSKKYLEENREKISALLDQLPAMYQYLLEVCGCRFNFLRTARDAPPYACWAVVVAMKALYMMALVTGLVKEVAPREFWDTLPGGQPYYVVKKDEVV